MNPNASCNPFNSNYDYACRNTTSNIDWNQRFKSRLNPNLSILDYKLKEAGLCNEAATKPNQAQRPTTVYAKNHYDEEYRNYLKKIFELFNMNGMTDNFDTIDKKVPTII